MQDDKKRSRTDDDDYHLIDDCTVGVEKPSILSVDTNVQEPERKKLKATTIDEYVEDTKYWYHIISNLDGCGKYKKVDKLERGITDPEKVIENLNQIWHVDKARLVLESLDLGNAYWRKDWFDLTSHHGEVSECPMDSNLNNLVFPAELGLTSEISKSILKDFISKREDIESHGLFLVEKLFKRCRVHSVEEITEMIQQCIDINHWNLETFYTDLCCDSNTDKSDKVEIKSLIEKWQKYILPQVVKTQSELNMIDDHSITIENNEESTHLLKVLTKTKDDIETSTEDKGACLLEARDFTEEEDILIAKEEEFIYHDNEPFEDEVFFYTYLFDLKLPDENETFGNNFSLLMHGKPNNQDENIFLKILEITMKMYIKGTIPLEHQDSEVSEMRMGVSLMILDCLNKELTYLLLSKEKEHTYVFYRALVRAVLDHFIVDYCRDTKYDKYIFANCPNPVPMVNIMFGDEQCDQPIGDTYNICWDIGQQQRGTESEWSDSEASDVDEPTNNTHPLFGNIEELKQQYLTQQTNGCSKISRQNLDDSMYITYYSNDKPITEPLTDQNLVSFFRIDTISYEEPNTYEESVDNLIENRSIDCHYRDDKSLHLDLTRILRRAGVMSNDEGVLLEGYTTLRNYISLIFQKLEERVKDRLVEVEDIEIISKILAIDESEGKEHIDLQVPYYYRLDYTENTTAANSFEEVVEDDLDNTEIVAIPETTELIREYQEGLGKDLYKTLGDDQMVTHCDSFVMTEDGTKVGVYTPIIKCRLPQLFEQFFDTEEKKRRGLDISTVHFEVCDGEQLVFDERVVIEWLACLYTGVFEQHNLTEASGTLTLEKLLAKWTPETESSTEQQEKNNDKEKFEDSSDEESESSLSEYSTSEESESEDDSEDYDQYKDSSKNTGCSIQDEPEITIPSQNLSKLFLDDESKDLSLHIANGFKIKVHRYILCMRSSYFKVLFSGNFSDKNVMEYDVSDFLKNSQSLQLFCNFLYSDTLENENFTQEYYIYQNLVDLLDLSHFLLCDKLKVECTETIQKYLNDEGTVELLKFSLQSNREDLFNIAHTLLLKSTYPYFGTIIDDSTKKYYQVVSTSLTMDNAILKLDYLTKVEQENTLHQFFIDDAKMQMENIHWFVAHRASSLDNKVIRTLPQPIQDLISRFHTHDNLGMASFEML